jgi:predicted DNA-binding protein (UPF0251 family)
MGEWNDDGALGQPGIRGTTAASVFLCWFEMTQNVAQPTLSAKQLEAAALVAVDELTNEEIAERVGVARRTLDRWKLLDHFDAAVQRAIERMDRDALRFAVARRDKRLQTINDLFNKGLSVIDARSQEYADDSDAIGGVTGLIIKDRKGVGAGAAAEVIDVYGVDTALISELRGLMDDAAREVGGRTQNVNLSGGLVNTIEFVGVDPEAI